MIAICAGKYSTKPLSQYHRKILRKALDVRLPPSRPFRYGV
jgi:hypothetical protein